jgi:hypothetical protein
VRKARALLATAAAALAAAHAGAFLGVGDTSFVTIIANPAEAANWAAQLEKLNAQLAAASATLQAVATLRAYAGDPRAALAALPDLAQVSRAVDVLASGGQTAEDLLQAWQAEGSAQRLLGEAALLRAAGVAPSMGVFGAEVPRDPSVYARIAGDAGSAAALRGQIAGEQQARRAVASELALAWIRFRAAPDESSKQAVLSEISQLQAQDALMDSRRRAILDDLALSDRQQSENAAVRSRAADEALLAQSGVLNAGAGARARDAEAARMATLAKPPAAAPAADYGGLRVWTTADAAGGAP